MHLSPNTSTFFALGAPELRRLRGVVEAVRRCDHFIEWPCATWRLSPDLLADAIDAPKAARVVVALVPDYARGRVTSWLNSYPKPGHYLSDSNFLRLCLKLKGSDGTELCIDIADVAMDLDTDDGCVAEILLCLVAAEEVSLKLVRLNQPDSERFLVQLQDAEEDVRETQSLLMNHFRKHEWLDVAETCAVDLNERPELGAQYLLALPVRF